jgi:hypothetical protein
MGLVKVSSFVFQESFFVFKYKAAYLKVSFFSFKFKPLYFEESFSAIKFKPVYFKSSLCPNAREKKMKRTKIQNKKIKEKWNEN